MSESGDRPEGGVPSPDPSSGASTDSQTADPWARPPEPPTGSDVPRYAPPTYSDPGPAPVPPAYSPPPYSPPTDGQPAYGQPAYGQRAYGQPPYGASPYGAAPTAYSAPGYPGGYAVAAPQTSAKATTVLVLGIASLVLLFAAGIGVIAAVISLVMSGSAKREIQASGGRLVGLGMVTAGRVMSWISVAVVALVIIGVTVALVSGGGGSSGGPYGGY